MNYGKTIFVLALVAVVLISEQCSGMSYISSADSSKHKYVFAGNPALASIVREISGNRFDISSIANGTSLHARRLTLNTAMLLHKGSIVFYSSRESQPAVFNISKKMNNVIWVEICRDEIFVRKLISMGYYHEGGTGNINGHIWTVPEVMSAAAEVIARSLSERFPEMKMIFHANLKRVQKSLFDLHAEATRELHLCNKVRVFSLHNGFFYMDHAFKLKCDSLGSDIDIGLSPHSLQRYKEMSKNENMVALFVDHSHIHGIHSMQKGSNSSMKPIAIDTDGMLVQDANGLNGYIEHIRHNIRTLKENLCIRRTKS